MLYQEIIQRTAAENPIAAAIVFEEQVVSYAELQEKIDAVAENLWRLGIRQGSVLGSYFKNSVENIVFSFACFKIGALFVPIRALLQEPQIRHIVRDANPELIVTSADLAPELFKVIAEDLIANKRRCYIINPTDAQLSLGRDFAELQTVHAEKVFPDILISGNTNATVLYTSGSTSDPKGAVHSHEQWLYNTRICVSDFDIASVTYLALSVNHAYGFGQQVLPILMRGGTMVLCNGFSPDDFWQAVTTGIQVAGNNYVADSFYGVPAMYQALVQSADGYVATNLKYLDVAGDILPPVVSKKLLEIFGHIVRPTFGMSEVLRLFLTAPGDHSSGPVIGFPQEGVEYKIFDKDFKEARFGELCIKSPTLCKHYLNSNLLAESTVNGYFRTGDIVSLGEDGQLLYINRQKRVIVTEGGYNINPRDVENIIDSHPKVKQSCVFDIDDAEGRKLIVALACLVEKGSVSAQVLFELFNAIEVSHRPSIVALIDKFKRGSSGKIDWRAHKNVAEIDMQTPAVDNNDEYFDVRNDPGNGQFNRT